MTSETALQQALKRCRSATYYVLFFSLGINLLMLMGAFYSLQVYDRILSSSSIETLVALTVLFVVAYIILGFLQWARAMVLVRIGNWLDLALTPDLFRESVRVNNRHQLNVGGQLFREFNTLKQFVAGTGVQQLADMPWAPIFMIVLFFIHPLVGFITLISAVLLFGLAVLNEFKTKKPFVKSNELSTHSLRSLELASRNAMVIDAMGMLPQLLQRFQRLNLESIDAQNEAAQASQVLLAVTKTIRMCIQTVIMGTSAYLVITHKMSPGGIIAASIISGKALAPFDSAIQTWKSVLGAREAYSRIQKWMGPKVDLDQLMQLPEPTGAVLSEGVTFAYPNMKVPILKQLQFEVPAGLQCVIIGPSGSGKSTLAAVLAGIWKPSMGAMRLDGADMGTWHRSDLGRYIGFLPQDVELFSGTIKENIARMALEIDDEAVIDAAKRAGAYAMILEFPMGFDTEIGPNGTHLSAGQRQRVGLARALFGRPKLVILDEPNAHLDQVGEQALLACCELLKKEGVTTFLVSHKPSLLAYADLVLVLNGGTVQYFGPKEKVLSKLMPDQNVPVFQAKRLVS